MPGIERQRIKINIALIYLIPNLDILVTLSLTYLFPFIFSQCMRSSRPELLPFNPEIERTCRRNRKERRLRRQMADPNAAHPRVQDEDGAEIDENQRTLKDYFRPILNEHYSGIRRQPINANNFELKPALISMVQQNQYGGLPSEDPNTHLNMFMEIADTIKLNGVTQDAIRMRLFPFSLRDRARAWLHSIEPGSIGTWEELASRFLSRFFPPAKTSQLRTEIALFRQRDAEPLHEAWDRFNEMIRKCPQHGYQE